MPSVVIVGAQWGDEGKGKLVDYLTERADCVARFNGGNNAGHTLVVGGKKTKLNLVPSGILRSHTLCCIGAAVAIDPFVCVQELDMLAAAGIEVSPKRLKIDYNAQLVMPYHIARDQAREQAAGASRIGTTGRGIGPCYEDRAARTAIRFVELGRVDELRERIERSVAEANAIVARCGGAAILSADEVFARLKEVAVRLAPYASDVSALVAETYQAGGKVVFEGAQATYLDVTFGTVPYVTSSTTLAAAAATGVGVGPRLLDEITIVTKAYTTRVGSGPFPTELLDEQGERIRERGGEFGTVTGRPRRCGWLDLVMVKRAVQLNGATSVALTKLDVLSGFEQIPVAVGYRLAGAPISTIPPLLSDLADVSVEWEGLPGWSDDLGSIREYTQLPAAARRYIEFIEDALGVPVTMVSVGAERAATVWKTRRPIFDLFVGAA